jgi:hypothetical protein
MTPRGLTPNARQDWTALASATRVPKVFDPGSVEHLPEPAQRWLCHATAAGTPLHTAAEVQTRGQLRLGAWRPFMALQRLTPTGGFVWSATARLFGLPIVGFDW